MDIKLDFIPPSFINFVSRQLVGAGFKLYKKVNVNWIDSIQSPLPFLIVHFLGNDADQTDN